MAKQLLKAFFKGRKYATVEEALTHAQEISRAIMARQKPKPAKLSGLEQRLLEIAPRFYDQGYYHREIATYLLSRTRSRWTKGELELLKKKVGNRLKRLTGLGLLPAGSPGKVHFKLRNVRDAAVEKVEANLPLVRYFLRHGQEHIPRYWHQYLSYDEAVEHGAVGLKRAIELHRPERGKLSTYAAERIGRAIGRAVEKQRKIKKTVSLDVGRDDDHRNLYGKLGEAQMDPEAFDEDDLELLIRNPDAKPQHVGIFTLTNIYGHGRGELARHFGVTRQATNQVYREAEKMIAKSKARN